MSSRRSESFNDIAQSLIPGSEKKEKLYRCLCCNVSGNALSLLTAFVLFSTITAVQYYYATVANSNALKADCVSMAVDALAFLGNLFAECLPQGSALGKRRIELLVRNTAN